MKPFYGFTSFIKWKFPPRFSTSWLLMKIPLMLLPFSFHLPHPNHPNTSAHMKQKSKSRFIFPTAYKYTKLKKKERNMCTCVCLMCLGDKLPGLFRLLSLSWDGVERRLSFSGGLAGRTGTAPGKTGVFFLLEGGTREGGNREGTDSFSRAL